MTTAQQLTGIEQRLRDHIMDRADILRENLVRYVAIPTGKGYSPGLAAYRDLIVQRLKALGAEVELVAGEPRPWWLTHPVNRHQQHSQEDQYHAVDAEPIVIARHHPVPGAPRVLITGHLDTVHDPDGSFREVTFHDDGVYATGPGVVDMKGGIVITLAALEVLKECGVECNWTILFNSDEETGSFQSLNTIKRVSAEHDFGIAVEPALADGSLAIERMGSGQFMIEVHGRSSHVGRAFDEGISAVTKLGEILIEIDSLADTKAGRIANVGPLQGGEVTNAVPDFAACWGNIRYHDAPTGRELVQQLQSMEGEGPRNPGAPGPHVVVHHLLNRPAKPKTPAVEKFALAARDVAEALGQQLPFASTGGVCDGNLMQAAGLPTLDTLGVRGGNLHRPDEFIELPSLVERAQLLAVLLARIASGRVRIES